VEYVTGAVAGAVFGCLVGYLKYMFIWNKYAAAEDVASGDYSGEATKLYSRAFISYGVNIGALALVFFLRELYPFSWIACIIATAIALSVMNRVMALRAKKTTQNVNVDKEV
jgi:hypothetical protein